MSVCEVNNLCKHYPTFSLQDVTFQLQAGRCAGFIGRNGAGKSTTIKCMLGLVHADGGDVRFFDMPFAANQAEIKQRLGYSTGAVNYYPKRKIKDIVAVTKTFYPNWDEAVYQKYLQLFGLDVQKTPSELSAGMKVKFNLLLALSHKAEVLILDEPTSGLDPFSRDEVLDILDGLKAQGVSILFSTHITSDIEKSADDILYIRGGQLIAACSKKDFTAQFCKGEETLEQVILRMEKEAAHACKVA
jgi:ABC-2 type transport system ATP-binding protein